MTQKFDGKAFATEKLIRVQQQVEQWKETHLADLVMVSIYPQEDEASVLYTKLKKQDATKAGIRYITQPMSLKMPRHDWLRAIMKVNHDEKVQALLVQKPSAVAYEKSASANKHEDFSTWWNNLAESIEPKKDVDCLAPWSLFQLEKEAEQVAEKRQSPQDSLAHWLLPATAQAVIDIACNVVGGIENLRSKTVVVIGRSVIVGRPAAAGFTTLGAQTQLVSSQGKLAEILPQADIIVSATGVADLISPEMVKNGAVLIDVGAPKPEFQIACYEKASFYTPVPFGVGPVTRACLLENVFKLPTLASYAKFQ